ncbi:hypothetical protein CGX12_16570 [Zobellella denitrificans]|uniref:hypothetical protein n=1 Tax=Zobellella denitrificans TaxID=347534 RepID=UPI000B8BB8DA|nr:hypothetical protein [Zobellella denitrificans]OXS13995.1 hypothetical protein CGX12_16570 [Zobellella denitrificans]
MHGLPRILQTRADYERALAMAASAACRPADALPHFVGLLESRWAYQFDRLLTENEHPDGAAPDYLVSEAEGEDGTLVRAQHRRAEQPGAKIHRLGYTVAEVTAIIAQLESM